VKSLVSSNLPAGDHQIVWDGRDENRNALKAGVYFYQLRVDGQTVGSKRTMLLK
jgi:flagellar hook assembly protein FlgD